ncbi:hypothetical protein HY967_03465 [Candidatus Jorgensenbacteria bacterium]|nr:hypothetical protein [Candidatus Jorgensenbacteria bacterium]
MDENVQTAETPSEKQGGFWGFLFIVLIFVVLWISLFSNEEPRSVSDAYPRLSKIPLIFIVDASHGFGNGEAERFLGDIAAKVDSKEFPVTQVVWIGGVRRPLQDRLERVTVSATRPIDGLVQTFKVLEHELSLKRLPMVIFVTAGEPEGESLFVITELRRINLAILVVRFKTRGVKV